MSRPEPLALKQQFDAVQRLVFKERNPVGVSDLPDDYYDTYVWQIVRLLREGADEATLAQHLCDVEQINFGRDTTVELLMPAATSLVALGIKKEPS